MQTITDDKTTTMVRVVGQFGIKEFQDLFSFVENDRDMKKLKKDFKKITKNVKKDSVNGS